MDELALFAGAGGGILGGQLCGWRTRCAVEIAPYARQILLARQRDGALPRFPIWDDIRTFDGEAWRGSVDVVSGGFPCTSIAAPGKREGVAGDGSSLWFEMQRVIGEVQPVFAFIENSPHLRTRGLGTVLKGLARMGYECRWCVLGAWHCGANHRRNRMWILAHPNNGALRDIKQRHERWRDTISTEGEEEPVDACATWDAARRGGGAWWPPVAPVSGVDDGHPSRLDRYRCIGNAQVPRVAALAWRILSQGLVGDE